MAKTPILLDTDIGSDIDDMVALAYLLKQPRCELLGVTTVTGEPEQRARLVDAACRAFGRTDVPIHSGAARPLLGAQRQATVPQADVLSRWAHRKDFAPNAAVDFLRETIRSRPGEITLLTIGPLTNAALLYALDPQIPSLLKAHVMMAGVYSGGVPGYHVPEWNASCDPTASAIVFAATGVPITCIGLDVTTQCTMDADACRRRFADGPLKLVGEMAEVWYRNKAAITFHDPLAAAVVFEPSLCAFVPGRVEVELQSVKLAGYTLFTANTDPAPHRVATKVTPSAFFDHYFAVVGG